MIHYLLVCNYMIMQEKRFADNVKLEKILFQVEYLFPINMSALMSGIAVLKPYGI